VCIQVGNEFSSVEALWSQFENVMAKEPEEEGGEQQQKEEEGERSKHEGDHDRMDIDEPESKDRDSAAERR